MNRRRGCVWFAAGLLLAMVTGGLILISLLRAAQGPSEQQVEEPARVPAVVAVRDIPLHSVIGPDDVSLEEVPPELVPDGAYANTEDLLGMLTTAVIARGEVVLQRRLIAPDYVGPRAAFVLDPSRVLVAFPAFDLLGGLGIVRPGDHVDIMFSYDFAKANPNIFTGTNTFTLLQDQEIAAVVYDQGSNPEGSSDNPPSGGSGAPQAFLIAVDPQDALMIKYFRDSGASQDLALRNPAAHDTFDVVPIDGDYLLERLQIRYRTAEGQ